MTDLLAASLALAQAAPAGQGDAAASSVQVNSVWDFIVKGGPLMIPIGLCSLVGLAIIVERMVSLRRKQIIPPGFLPGLRNLLKSGREDRSAAIEYCRTNASPVANIFLAGLKHMHEPVERMEKFIQEAGEREVQRLRKNLRSLSVIGSIAPLLGLLGTITGMINAFQTVAASAEALGRTELLAKGIYEAMITTAGGLIVAIPVIVAYHWIAAKIDRLVQEIDDMTVTFLEEQTIEAAPVHAAPARATSTEPVLLPQVGGVMATG